jgi:hypothetical protein
MWWCFPKLEGPVPFIFDCHVHACPAPFFDFHAYLTFKEEDQLAGQLLRSSYKEHCLSL